MQEVRNFTFAQAQAIGAHLAKKFADNKLHITQVPLGDGNYNIAPMVQAAAGGDFISAIEAVRAEMRAYCKEKLGFEDGKISSILQTTVFSSGKFVGDSVGGGHAR